MGLRFSFDIGTNSIGHAVWRTGRDPAGVFGEDAPLELLHSGVRIFKDGRNPKDGKSLAEMRRIPKSARIRRDRFAKRRHALIDTLVGSGLMPADGEARKELEALDPYRLRAEGLDRELSLHELGRALFHLNQRRGFQSNRKADRRQGKDDDKGKIATASKALAERLEAENARTFGEFLWRRQRGQAGDPARPRDPGRKPTRIRLEGEGAKALYAFYPTRQMLKDEFDQIWAKQALFHPGVLTDALRVRLRDHVIFYQRDLKPPKIGWCTLVEGEQRLPKALPSVEAREVYERLGHLRLFTPGGGERPLTVAERNAVASVLLYEQKLTFKKLRTALRLGSDVTINVEEAGEKDLKGSLTAARLVKPDHFGPSWRTLSWAERDAFVRLLLDEADDIRLTRRLMREYKLNDAQARECAGVPLADGYSRFGATANAAILDALIFERDDKGFVVPYSEAVRRAGEKAGFDWHHSDERDGVILDALPYYGATLQRHVLPGSFDRADRRDEARYFGRISNPTVHVGLNQLRKVVNALIAMAREQGWSADGHPDQIVVELARDLKLSQEKKDRLAAENRRNREANEKRRELIGEVATTNNERAEDLDTPVNRVKLRLFEEQKTAGDGVALCPFSLRPIPITRLFSDEIEIEHLLPWSRSLDDSMPNKVVCYRDMNRLKRGRTPHEAFSGDARWAEIEANAATLPKNKRWRFGSDAMDRFDEAALGRIDRREREAMGLGSGFLARQLNETKYLSRLARAYLGRICDPDAIYVTPGTLTGLLRGKWGLNTILDAGNIKNRDDHRHHAVDAVVIGAMTRGLINYLSHEAARRETSDFEAALDRIPWPFDGFREAIRRSIDAIAVSHKAEHGKGGALHEDTAYGLVRDETEAASIGNLVRRKPVADLTVKEVDAIRDPKLRAAARAVVVGFRDDKGKLKKGEEKAFGAALVDFATAQGMRRVRVGKEDRSVVAIADRRTGESYKAVVPGENHHIDIVALRDGSWRGFAASVFEVNRKGWRPVWERDRFGGKLVMRLHKGDMVEVDDPDGARRIKTVVRLEPSANRIRLVSHNEGGDFQKRHDDPDDAFRWDFAGIAGLKDRNCVAVTVDPVGRVTRKMGNA
jgi:CRISPR-associated endonuclease Csn1